MSRNEKGFSFQQAFFFMYQRNSVQGWHSQVEGAAMLFEINTPLKWCIEYSDDRAS